MVIIPDLNEVRDGDLAFAWNVQDIADVLHGQRALSVRLTKWSHPTLPTLKLANRHEHGPILEIVQEDLVTRVLLVDRNGLASARISGFFDWKYQLSAPAAPGVGTQTIRMYARGGQLYFKVEGSGEQQIPVGAPPGPSMRYSFWTGG